MQRIILLSTFFIVSLSYQTLGQNAIANYDPNYPSWTNEIRWDNVIDMSSYSNGSTDFEKFENARDELYAQGGGVLFYPAGEYSFPEVGNNNADGRGLMLKSGVVILGETPTDTDATDGSLNLATKFKFSYETTPSSPPFGGGEVPYAWNMVGIMPSEGEELKDVSNVGIAWVELQGATVYFGLDANWGGTYASSGAWYSGRASTGIWSGRVPDGTHPLDVFAGYNSGNNEYKGAGSNRFVFGCAIKDATVHNPKIIDYSRGGNFNFYNYKFGSRIAIYGSNVYVVNNVLPKSDKNFVYTQTTAITQQDRCNQAFGTHESKLLYDYGKTFGIDINKTFLNVFPNKSEGYFKENIIVKNNFIYNHGAKGVDISGKWMLILNNHNERDYLQEGDDVYGVFGADEWELTVDGYFESVLGGNGCLSDNQARAFDMAGEAIWLDQNSWNNLGSNPGNDGESILCQRHGGTDIHSWALTRNSHLNSYNLSNKGYLSGYDVHNQGMFVAWNNTLGSIGNLKAGDLYDCTYIPNGEETFLVDYGPGEKDFISACPEETPTKPSQVLVEWAADSAYIEISWVDDTENEIGYRVDKKVVGADNWNTIVYRPRQSKGHSRNEPKWKDFSANKDINFEYRVVAIGCEDNEAGASDWVTAKEEELSDPTIEPSMQGSIYQDSIEINISVPNVGADIYYTLDGSEPDQNSNKYTAPFAVWEATTIKAKVFKGSLEPSTVQQFEVKQLDAPVVSTCENDFSELDEITPIVITANELASEIRYSFNDADIDGTDFLYAQPLEVGADTTIYARAFGADILPSPVVSCEFKVVLSLEEISDLFQIFPNPASEELHIKLEGPAARELKIQLIDVNGRILRDTSKLNSKDGSMILNVANIQPGVYFVKAISNGQEVSTQKIMIQ